MARIYYLKTKTEDSDGDITGDMWGHSKMQLIAFAEDLLREGLAKSCKVYEMTFNHEGSPRHLLVSVLNKDIKPESVMIWKSSSDCYEALIQRENNND